MIDTIKTKKYTDDVSKMSSQEIAMVFSLIREKINKEVGFNYSTGLKFAGALLDNSETSKLINILMDLYKKDAPDYLKNLDKDRKWILAYRLAGF